MRPRVAFALMFACVLAVRLTHSGIVWVEEGYPSAAALQILNGAALYRDVWFDKPPLSAYLYMLWGAKIGWMLRLVGALFVTLCCWLIYQLGEVLWGRREGLIAAGLLAFYLTFGIPSAVMALAPDLLMVAPHIAAVWLAALRRPAWSGFLAGIAMLLNAKGLFVLAVCLLWNPAGAVWTLAGFAFPVAVHLAWLDVQGALMGYWVQVWDWGFKYSSRTFVEHPVRESFARTLNWAGFQATAVIGALIYWGRRRDKTSVKLLAWALVSLAGVGTGWRFFPRYYFQLLPVMALAGARGIALLDRKQAAAVLLLLVIPLARFGPRYVQLGLGDRSWRDLAMSKDAQQAAGILNSRAGRGDTLFVWGYRPDLYPLTRIPAGTRFLDSQALTGVLADRHLASTEVLYPQIAERTRKELALTQPTFVVDGLGPYNPALAISQYPDLGEWLLQYREVARTRGTVIYRLNAPASTAPASPEMR